MQRRTIASLVSSLAHHGTFVVWQSPTAGLACPAVRRCASGVAETETETVKTSNIRIAQRAGAVALCGAMGWAAASAAEDVYIYDQCSSKALEKASQDPRLKEFIGEEIKLGQWHWYEASLAVAHKGMSASCSFPVYGSHGTANLHLKAVRLHGRRESVFHNIFGGGQWEVLMLEAQVPGFSDGNSASSSQRINLMQTSDEPKTGDGAKGEEAGPCISANLQEV
ncbi:hypothetical protein Mapa_002523 [Marchantia paleacea]|nr:hypothetical protein Mapa_002523 [Marchantia paleacea]